MPKFPVAKAVGAILCAAVAAPGFACDTSITPNASFRTDYALTDHTGAAVTAQTYAGRYQAILFGYTYCPDVCPLGMANIADALAELPEDVKARLQPVFVSVDPDRDDVATMAAFVETFGEDFIGLTGSAEDIKAASRSFGVIYWKELSASPTDYLVSHSNLLYVVGPDGEACGALDPLSPIDVLAETLARIVRS